MMMLFGRISSRMSSGACERRQRLRTAIATAFFATSWARRWRRRRSRSRCATAGAARRRPRTSATRSAQQHHHDRPYRRGKDRDRAATGAPRGCAVPEGRSLQVHRGRLRGPRRRVHGARARGRGDQHGAHRARGRRLSPGRSARGGTLAGPAPPPDPDTPDGRPSPPAPGSGTGEQGAASRPLFVVSSKGDVTPAASEADVEAQERRRRTREKLRQQLKEGTLEEREVEIEVQQQGFPGLEMMQPPQGMEGTDVNFTELLQEMLPKKKKRRTVHLHEARRILVDEELKKLVDMDDVVNESLDRVENHGVIFIDEIDKIAGERGTVGPDVSREGVQRDLLPIVEGSTVQTRYGFVRTDHILFIAAGAFHVSKPSDLIPELQGRFPIRVELQPLTIEDFKRILTEPKNSIVRQYKALLDTEGIEVTFTDDAIDEIAHFAFSVNETTEDIGARRLHTIMTTLLEDVLFDLPEFPEKHIVFDGQKVRDRLARIVDDEDLRRYIL